MHFTCLIFAFNSAEFSRLRDFSPALKLEIGEILICRKCCIIVQVLERRKIIWHYAKYPKGCLRQYIHINRRFGPTVVKEKAVHDVEDVTFTLNMLKGKLSCSICVQVLSSEQSFGSWILPFCSVSSPKNSLCMLQDMGKQKHCSDLTFKKRPKSVSHLSLLCCKDLDSTICLCYSHFSRSHWAGQWEFQLQQSTCFGKDGAYFIAWFSACHLTNRAEMFAPA